MNTNMAWFRCFSKIFASLCFGERSLSIGRVKQYNSLKTFIREMSISEHYYGTIPFKYLKKSLLIPKLIILSIVDWDDNI